MSSSSSTLTPSSHAPPVVTLEPVEAELATHWNERKRLPALRSAKKPYRAPHVCGSMDFAKQLIKYGYTTTVGTGVAALGTYNLTVPTMLSTMTFVASGGLVVAGALAVAMGSYGAVSLAHSMLHKRDGWEKINEQFEDRPTAVGLLRAIEEALAKGSPSVPPNSPLWIIVLHPEIVKVMLAFSLRLYKRNDRGVLLASEVEDEQALDALTAVDHVLTYNNHEHPAYSAELVRRFAFRTVFDFGSCMGPFVGTYEAQASAEPPHFLVLCFRGASIEDPTKFIEELTPTLSTETSFLGSGKAQQSFYDDLFGSSTGNSAFDELVLYLRSRVAAGRTPDKDDPPTQLRITGHGLGAALASLFFARVLQQPELLGEHIKLADCFVFGAPRFVDADFASAFDGLVRNRPSPSLFRFTTDNDMSNTLLSPTPNWRHFDSQEVRMKLDGSIKFMGDEEEQKVERRVEELLKSEKGGQSKG